MGVSLDRGLAGTDGTASGFVCLFVFLGQVLYLGIHKVLYGCAPIRHVQCVLEAWCMRLYLELVIDFNETTVCVYNMWLYCIINNISSPNDI